MLNFREKIENAMSNFEDAGYKYSISETLYIKNQVIPISNSRSSNNLYNILKSVATDDKISFGRAYQLSISDKGPLSSYKKWIWYNDEIKLAIRRITEDTGDIELHRNAFSTTIIFKLNDFTLFNVKSLCIACKSFNVRNLGCTISPKFKDSTIKLTLLKKSNNTNIDDVKSEVRKNFEIKEFNFENDIVAEADINKIKLGNRVFSIYEK